MATGSPDLGGGGAKPGGTRHSTQAQTQAQFTDTAPAAISATPPASTPTPTTPTAQQQADSTNQQSAQASISAFLTSIPGLSTLDPNGLLGSWMNQQVRTLAGQGIDSGTIVSTIENTINNPTGDPAAKAVFDQIFPGYNEKIQNGTSNANGQYTGISGYIAYANQLQQFASVADLTPGTLNAQTIGQLWANDVSASEVSSRVTQGYVAAQNAIAALPGTADYLQSQGITTGNLASYFLDPTNALSDLQMQTTLNQGVIAGESRAAGFGNVSQSQNAALSAFLAAGNQSGLGGNGQVSTTAANQFFQSGIGGGVAGVNALSVAQAGAGLTSGPGGTVSADQVIAAGEGNVQANQAVSNVQQSRTAGSRGGGGAVTTAAGATGLGYGQSE